jgi:hypothetical protein
MDCECVLINIHEGVDEICVRCGADSLRVPENRPDNLHCDECAEAIISTDPYEFVWYEYEGDFDTAITCASCLALREAFFCDGYYYGGLMESLSEHVTECVCEGQIPYDAIAKLPPKARARICDMVQDAWMAPAYDAHGILIVEE